LATESRSRNASRGRDTSYGLSLFWVGACEERPAHKFPGPDLKRNIVTVDAPYVRKQLADIVKNQVLSRYIL
jgi:hypothetical protein